MTADADNRKDLLDLYARLRVADVRDALDAMMMHRTASMSQSIRPLWRTRACGIARCVRYVPYDGNVPTMTPQQYAKWTADYYRDVCPYPWMNDIVDGDFIVIDASGVDAGLMGSENTLAGLRKGARGYITSGGVRDSDEVIGQKVPFWSALISQSMVQGRLRFDAKDVPVTVGGALVHPGDVIVADGDGVIVVPRAMAEQVAALADAEHKRDIKTRQQHYLALNMRPDATIQ